MGGGRAGKLVEGTAMLLMLIGVLAVPTTADASACTAAGWTQVFGSPPEPVSNSVISASLDSQGGLTIAGSGFPPDKNVVVRATYGGTILNTWAQTVSDSSGNFNYQQPTFFQHLYRGPVEDRRDRWGHRVRQPPVEQRGRH